MGSGDKNSGKRGARPGEAADSSARPTMQGIPVTTEAGSGPFDEEEHTQQLDRATILAMQAAEAQAAGDMTIRAPTPEPRTVGDRPSQLPEVPEVTGELTGEEDGRSLDDLLASGGGEDPTGTFAGQDEAPGARKRSG